MSMIFHALKPRYKYKRKWEKLYFKSLFLTEKRNYEKLSYVPVVVIKDAFYIVNFYSLYLPSELK